MHKQEIAAETPFCCCVCVINTNINRPKGSVVIKDPKARVCVTVSFSQIFSGSAWTTANSDVDAYVSWTIPVVHYPVHPTGWGRGR